VPEVEETKEMITMLGRQDRPIIVGPWLTEAGFELLYWIPFLAWAKAYASLRDDQLIIVSRGGSAPWYRHISPNYHDILSLFTADEFRQRNDARVHEQKGRLKHIDLGEFDREIIELVWSDGGYPASGPDPGIVVSVAEAFASALDQTNDSASIFNESAKEKYFSGSVCCGIISM